MHDKRQLVATRELLAKVDALVEAGGLTVSPDLGETLARIETKLDTLAAGVATLTALVNDMGNAKKPSGTAKGG